MKKDVIQNGLTAGNVGKEMAEIKKMQKSVDSFLTIWSNTCTDFMSIVCC